MLSRELQVGRVGGDVGWGGLALCVCVCGGRVLLSMMAPARYHSLQVLRAPPSARTSHTRQPVRQFPSRLLARARTNAYTHAASLLPPPTLRLLPTSLQVSAPIFAIPPPLLSPSPPSPSPPGLPARAAPRLLRGDGRRRRVPLGGGPGQLQGGRRTGAGGERGLGGCVWVGGGWVGGFGGGMKRVKRGGSGVRGRRKGGGCCVCHGLCLGGQGLDEGACACEAPAQHRRRLTSHAVPAPSPPHPSTLRPLLPSSSPVLPLLLPLCPPYAFPS